MSSADDREGNLKGNFHVCVRLRPQNLREDQHAQSVPAKRFVNIVGNTVQVSDIIDAASSSLRHREKQFEFDEVFDDTCSTSEIFVRSIEPAVTNIISGYNSTVFAYGMTGAGKSFTVFGDLCASATDGQEEGIAIMLLRQLLSQQQTIEQQQQQTKVLFSYLEIYNENVRDLMASGKQENLMVVEDPEKGVLVPDLSEIELVSVESFKELILQGNTRRVMASTAANQFSSRSHAVIQITCQQRSQSDAARCLQSKLCIVDLAGSERAASTENRGVRLAEGANINRSLLALGNCINMLADQNKRGSFVPYRDSKLTRLLKDSLGGNTKAIMIACVTQSAMCYEETVNTLKYAERARTIKKTVRKNKLEVAVERTSEFSQIIQSLKGEIVSLRQQLQTKSTENTLLKQQQQFVQKSTQGNETQEEQFVEGLEDIRRRLLENLEEQWEIKVSISEILSLNSSSEKVISEKEQMLIQASGLQLPESSVEQCRREVLKRKEVIVNNEQILSELNARLIRNEQLKKELVVNTKSLSASLHSVASIAPQIIEQDPTNNDTADARILTMQRKMEELQLQIQQKDQLLLHKQHIINNLEHTVSGQHQQTQLNSIEGNHSDINSSSRSQTQIRKRAFSKVTPDSLSTSRLTTIRNLSTKSGTATTTTAIVATTDKSQTKRNTSNAQRSISSSSSSNCIVPSICQPMKSRQLTTTASSATVPLLKSPLNSTTTTTSSTTTSFPKKRSIGGAAPKPQSQHHPRKDNISSSSLFSAKTEGEVVASFLEDQKHQQTSSLSTLFSDFHKKQIEDKQLPYLVTQSPQRPTSRRFNQTNIDHHQSQLPQHHRPRSVTPPVSNMPLHTISEVFMRQKRSSPAVKRVMESTNESNVNSNNSKNSKSHSAKARNDDNHQSSRHYQPQITAIVSNFEDNTSGYVAGTNNGSGSSQPLSNSSLYSNSQGATTKLIPPRIDEQRPSTSNVRSSSCLRQSSSGAAEMEVHSYAATRRKMREFKERLATAAAAPNKLSDGELATLLLEYSEFPRATLRNNEEEAKIKSLEDTLNSRNKANRVIYKPAAVSNALTENGCPQEKTMIHNSQQQKPFIPGSYAQLRQHKSSRDTPPMTAAAASTNSYVASISTNQLKENTQRMLPRGVLSNLSSNYSETLTFLSGKPSNTKVVSKSRLHSSHHSAAVTTAATTPENSRVPSTTFQSSVNQMRLKMPIQTNQQEGKNSVINNNYVNHHQYHLHSTESADFINSFQSLANGSEHREVPRVLTYDYPTAEHSFEYPAVVAQEQL